MKEKENIIEIWQPKYKTDSVLIATYKVESENTIIFTKAKHLEGMRFHITGEKIRECPVTTNGRITCYDVPMKYLDKEIDKEDIER